MNGAEYGVLKELHEKSLSRGLQGCHGIHLDSVLSGGILTQLLGDSLHDLTHKSGEGKPAQLERKVYRYLLGNEKFGGSLIAANLSEG